MGWARRLDCACVQTVGIGLRLLRLVLHTACVGSVFRVYHGETQESNM